MSEETTTINMEALTAAVTASVIAALKGISGDESKVDPEQKRASEQHIEDVNEWEQRQIDANLGSCNTTRQINNLLQQVFYKGDVKTVVKLRQQARREGGIRLANGLQRRAGVNFGVQLGNDFTWVD